MVQPLTPALALTPRSRLPGWLATAWRYGLSTSGPVATSGAHFLASLLLVRNLPAFQFGLFSFVLVIVPFCMSIVAALLVLPVNTALGDAARSARPCRSDLPEDDPGPDGAGGHRRYSAFSSSPGRRRRRRCCWRGSARYSTYRWFARCLAFVKGRAGIAIASDLAYAGALVTGLAALMVRRHVEFAARRKPAAGRGADRPAALRSALSSAIK